MAKRANHDGSVSFNAAKQLWVGAISFEDEQGRKQRKFVYAKTQTDASDRLKLLLANQVHGQQPSVDARSLAAYLADWLANDVKLNRSAGTFALYECLIRKHIVPTIGTVKLTAVGPKDVQRMQAKLIKDGLSPNSVRSTRGVLSAALNRAVKWGLIVRNPVPLVDPPRMSQDEPDVLTFEQAGRLLAAAEDHVAQRRLYVTLLSTGVRISECLGLRWSDIDFEQRTMRVSKQLDRIRKGGPRTPALVDLKTAGSRRTIPLTTQAVETLLAQRAHTRQQRLESEVAWSGDPQSDFCFSNELGRPWRANTCLHLLKAHAKRAGLPETVHLHSLRHSCATYLLAAGVADRIVMSILGHSNLRMTAKYQHVMSGMLSDAADKLGAIFPSAAAI